MVLAKAGLGCSVCRGAHMAGGHGVGEELGQEEDLLPLWRSLYSLLSYFEKKNSQKDK